MDPLAEITYTPIGVYRQPEHQQKADVPRQGVLVHGEGRIELARRTGIEHALLGLEQWSRLWIVFHFHQASGFRPTVWPPRSQEKRGVLATRSPHRPNAIGLSSAKLLRVDAAALELHVAEADLLDGTPVLDLKPYVPYADAFPDEASGWLTPKDPLPPWNVHFAANAERALSLLAELGESGLRDGLVDALALGPTPQPYRRIRAKDGQLELSHKAFRARFLERDGRTLEVLSVRSGYKPKQLHTDPALAAHRALEAFWDSLTP